ncbi:hypothetical protein KR093_000818 [Drosophila rubida]|uniref:Uncharacterized protein n=1 Tax=Drosophila rubida TaxID=30044 RepID=A0AAD4K8R6_9MUSC|nr:hypothetical protein KR093_000818 [Drosophila rubida]
MENKKRAASVSINKHTVIKSSRDVKQLSPKLESEDTLIEIKTKSSNKTKIGKPKLVQKSPSPILKDSALANTPPSKMTAEELASILENDSPFKPRNRLLVLRSPPDTPKVSATTILAKPQINTPSLLPSENPAKVAGMKPLKHRVDTVKHQLDIPKRQIETLKQQMDTIEQQLDIPKQQLDTPKQQLDASKKLLDTPKQSPVGQHTEMPKKTFTLDTPNSLPSPEESPIIPVTPPMAASKSPEPETPNNLQLQSLRPTETQLQQQRQTMMPSSPGNPIQLSSPPYVSDPMMYNPNEDWQQRLRSSQIRQSARAATVAAAAGAAAVAAQVRREALDAIARKQHHPRSKEEAPPANENPHHDQRRGIRNVNLLSSALSIIREMDPAYLEKLCYAIHDQLSKAEPLD